MRILNISLNVLILLLVTMAEAYAACSPYVGRASINEVYKDRSNQSANNNDLIEIKILDGGIAVATYQAWEIEIQENNTGNNNSDDGDTPTVFSLSTFSGGLPWLVLQSSTIGRYINMKTGFNVILRDADGNTIDYLAFDGYRSLEDSSCTDANLPFDNAVSSSGASFKLIERQPDGTGDWGGETSGSAPDTGTETNDDLGANSPDLAIGNTTINAGDSAVLTLTLSGGDNGDGSYSQSVIIDYQTLDGSLAAGTDYTAATGTFTIPANTLSISLNAIATSNSASAGEFYVLITNASGNAVDNNANITSSVGTVTITPSLVVEYRFEEDSWNGTTGEVADTTSNALDGTAINGPTTEDTTPDPAINNDPGTCRYGDFSGANQRVAVPDNDLLDLADALTITAWIYTTSTSQQTIVSKYSAFNFDYNYQLQLGAGGTLLFRYYSGGSANFVQTNLPSVVSTNTWTHVAVTYEDGAQRFYINGTEATGGGSNTGSLDTNDGALTIGTDVFFSFIPFFDFQGAIDEVRLYDGALSQSDIQAIYNETHACSSSPTSELLVLATQDSETLGGLSFDDEDAVLYDASDNTATLHFDGGNFSNDESLNAFSMLSNGNYIVSTEGNASLGGLSFDDDDLVEYNPNTDTATLYVNMRTIAGSNIDVNAAHALDNGDVIFSTTSDFSSFDDEDLILYDASSGSLSSYLDTSSIGASGSDDLSGVYVRENGNILMSFNSDTTIQGVSVLDGDIVEYNPSSGTASIYFSESEFSNGADVRAVHLIEADTGSTIDRYQISHSGTAVTCEPATVTITALDSSGSVVNVSGNTTLAVTTAPSGPSLSTASPVILDGTSSITIDVTQTSPLANIDFDVSDGSVSENDGDVSEDPSLTFVESILRFYDGNTADVISTQVAATDSANITLRAIRTDDNTGACVAALQGATDVEIAYECNSPNTCSGMANPMTILGNSSVSFTGDNDGSGPTYATVELTFDSNGHANSNFSFDDAGQITFSANIPDANISLSGSSQPFWVRPDKLVLSAQSGATPLNATTAVGTPTHAAGANFNLTVSAINADGNVTENYRPGNTQLSLQRTGPTTGINEGILTFNLGQTISSALSPSFSNASLATFDTSGSEGVSSYTNANYSEVGLVQLDAQDSSYGGAIIEADAINIGRFIPADFIVSVANQGAFDAFCDVTTAFSYIGQTIQYATSTPQIQVTARNSAGLTTQNYTGNFMKLDASEVSRVFPDNDGTNGLTVTRTPAPGALSLASEANGVITFDFDSTDNYAYTQSTGSIVAPFTSDLTIAITGVNDSEVTSSTVTTSSPVNVTPTGVLMRYGRWNMENTYGSELFGLSMPARVEYFDGTNGYVVNTDDACSLISSSTGTVIEISTTPAGTSSVGQIDDIAVADSSTDFSYNDQLIAGQGSFSFTAPGAHETGTVNVSTDLTKVPWLRHDWDGDGAFEDHPDTTATFGRYRGNDRIIYWREVSP